MSVVLARVEIPHASGLPEDTVINTFTFLTPTTPQVGSDLTKITGALQAFYGVAAGGAQHPIAWWLGDQLTRAQNACSIYYFNADPTGSPPGLGPPVQHDTWTLGPVGVPGSPLPAEVAICMSFAADLTGIAEVAPGGSRPRARRRGRVYLGPLSSSAVEFNAARNTALPNSALMPAICDAARALQQSLLAQTIAWAVGSMTEGVARQVLSVYVDDAFDTQRRRGEKPQFRVGFPITADLSRSGGDAQPMMKKA